MSYSYNLTDFEEIIRTYLKTNTAKKYPDLDTSDNSVFDDLYTKPNIANMSDFISSANYLDITMDLSDPEEIDDDTLDTIGYYNYGLTRVQGEKATVSVALSFASVSSTESLTIPKGAIFATSDGLEFVTTEAITFTTEELAASYSTTSLLYTVELDLTASEAGSEYNVGINQIVTFPTLTSMGLSNVDSVTNSKAATGGTDTETNTEYAKRIREFYITRYLGTKSNYEDVAKSASDSVTDVKVFGYGDDLMTRDQITYTESGTTKTVHIGGKVDIYLKGCNMQDVSFTHASKSKKAKLSNCTYANLYYESETPADPKNPSASDITSPSQTVSVTVSAGTSGDEAAYVTLANSELANAVHTIRVSYYDKSDNSYSEDFEVGTETMSLNSPVTADGVTVKKEDGTALTPITDYISLQRKDLKGNTISSSSAEYLSSQENDTLKFACDKSWSEETSVYNLINGENIVVSYSCNNSVLEEGTTFMTEDNRIITTDVLIKEAAKKNIEVGVKVKMKTDYELTDARKLKIKNVINALVEELKIGESIKQANVISKLCADSDVMSFADYINAPLEKFKVSGSSSTSPEAVITVNENEMIAIYSIEVTEVV